jgi:hypothetical protein
MESGVALRRCRNNLIIRLAAGGGTYYFKLYRHNTSVEQAQLAGSAFRHIHDAALGMRTTVVDDDFYRLACAGVGNPDFGAEWQGVVCSRELARPVGRATGRGPAIELIGVVGALAALRKSRFATPAGSEQCTQKADSEQQRPNARKS